MVDMPDPPPPPDPQAVAAGQTQANRAAAITQQNINSTNQITPYGNLTYDQIGVWDDGTPRYQATTSLSPTEQGLYNQQGQLKSGVNQLGINQVGRLTELLGKPVSLNNEATEARLFELGRARLDPLFAQRRSALDANLINRGINPGTEAYARAQTALNQQENDAYNQLLLGGRGQAVTEALSQRNQPINEITALMSGGQVSMPNFTGTPQANVAATDYAGIMQSGFGNQFANFNAASQQQQALQAGLFGLGSAALGAGGMALGGRPR